MKKFLFSGIIILMQQYTAAQYYPEKVNKKARELFLQAQERAADGNIAIAVGSLLKCIEIDNQFAEAYLSLGAAYGQLKNFNSSIKYYEKAFSIDTNYTLAYKIPYATILATTGEFEKALQAVTEVLNRKPPKNQTALDKVIKQRQCYEFAVSYKKNNPIKNYVFEPKNLGANINSAEPEYLPSLTIDGGSLLFTRRVNNVNEDFFISTKTTDGWDKAKPLQGEVNTPQNEAAQNISQDCQWLVFTSEGRPPNFGNYDIYFSFLNTSGWSEPLNAGGIVNSDQWDSQPCLSPDKKDLYFASRRLGGFGGIDIYVSHMLPNGKWGEPENLGPVINTTGDDQCPFIHADNQTLYFTSNSWPGYGGNDLFYSRKTNGGAWSKPVNLGYPLNTINDEGTLFVAADGKTAYYASDRSDSKGSHDIYSFELREDLRPLKTMWVKGKVFDSKSKKGLLSSVELVDMFSKEVITKINTDDSGNYFITLPVGKDYVFTVNRKEYLFYSDNFLLNKATPDSIYQKDIPLLSIEKDAIIVLKNIFFDVNKFEIKPASQVELEKLVQLLHLNPKLKIEISGHTDNVGKPTDNIKLSNNRAKAVVNYLIAKNIAVSRLFFKGYGSTKPVADNKTEEGKALNRRTEMKVISQ
jgi:outer membrane protein OmpA-like peptidoglycan-associated protein/tetratricopeptide (TPR) repeat protein